MADFTPDEKQEKKISSDSNLTLTLKPTPKLIRKARELYPNLFIVAFKAETDLNEEDLVERAFGRLQVATSDLVVANNVHSENKGRGFGSETNEVYVVDKNKSVSHLKLAVLLL